MKIALHNNDITKFPNLALMKISAYHKAKGDSVEWYMELDRYDKVYSSKIFNFSLVNDYLPKDTIKGGTGYDIQSKLPHEIEKCNPDYSIYDYDFSIQMFSRGCIRKCAFCVVNEKEGEIRPITPMKLNPKGKHVEVLDNNFFANPNWKEAIELLIKWKQPVNFHGVDIRILTQEQCCFLNKLKHIKQIHIAWDNPKEPLDIKIKEVLRWIKPYKLMCYVLIGFNSTPSENMERIEKLRNLKVDPFVMPFDKKNKYQKQLARWVNHKAVFKSCTFEEYNKEK